MRIKKSTGREVVWLHKSSTLRSDKKNLFPWDYNPDHSVRNVITIMTELSRLSQDHVNCSPYYCWKVQEKNLFILNYFGYQTKPTKLW
jgi:hypothetical protein